MSFSTLRTSTASLKWPATSKACAPARCAACAARRISPLSFDNVLKLATCSAYCGAHCAHAVRRLDRKAVARADDRDALDACLCQQCQKAHRIAAGGRVHAEQVLVAAPPQRVGGGARRERRIAVPVDDRRDRLGVGARVGAEHEIHALLVDEGLIDFLGGLGVAAVVADHDLHAAAEYPATLVDILLPEQVGALLQSRDVLVLAGQPDRHADAQQRHRLVGGARRAAQAASQRGRDQPAARRADRTAQVRGGAAGSGTSSRAWWGSAPHGRENSPIRAQPGRRLCRARRAPGWCAATIAPCCASNCSRPKGSHGAAA